MSDQFKFIKNKDLGFAPDHVYLIDLYENQASGDLAQLTRNCESLLASDPAIELVSGGYNINDPGVTSASTDEGFPVFEFRGDKNFPKMFNLQLIDGRYPAATTNTDSMKAVKKEITINESLHKAIPDCPVGEKCKWLNNLAIKGVMRDFNFQSLTENISPAYFRLDEVNITTIFFKTDGVNDSAAKQKIESVWKKLQQNKPVEVVELTDQLSGLYADQLRWSKIINFATGIALAISLFGLFGLSSVNSLNLRKEVAIRKVLGASSGDLIIKANSSIFKVLAIAFVIATPFTLYVMINWLNNFVYKVDISWISVSLAFIVGLVLALISTCYFTIKTLHLNSSEVLRQQ